MKFLFVATVLLLPNAVPGDGHEWRRRDTSDCHNCGTKNPCNPLKTAGLYYYPRCNNANKYVQCSAHGACYRKSCPDGLIWDQSLLTCINNIFDQGCPNCVGDDNPCNPLDVSGKFYYPHCQNADMYIQCSAYGDCYEKDCPDSTIWDDALLTCVSNVAGTGCCGGGGDPCNPLQVTGKYYYPHCQNAGMYIQCSAFGDCYEKDCPDSTNWDDALLTCV